MRRSLFSFVIILMTLSSLQAQPHSMIRLSAGTGIIRHPCGLDSELSGIIPFSQRFAAVVAMEWFGRHSMAPAYYGDDEIKMNIFAFRAGVCFFPVIQEKHLLSVGLLLGGGKGNYMSRKVLYYDSGPFYVYNEDDPIRKEIALFGDYKGVLPVAALAVDYVYFLTKNAGVGVSFQQATIPSIRASFTWRF